MASRTLASSQLSQGQRSTWLQSWIIWHSCTCHLEIVWFVFRRLKGIRMILKMMCTWHMYHLNAILSATCRTMENSFLKQNFGGKWKQLTQWHHGPSIVSPGFLLHFMRTESSGTAVALRAVATCFKVGVSKTAESPVGTSLFVLSDNVGPFFCWTFMGESLGLFDNFP